LGKQLTVALKAAGGAVDLHSSLESLGKGELQAALVVVHLDGELANAGPDLIARLSGDGRVIAVLPKTNLSAAVDIMMSSDRLAAMIVAEDFDATQLTGLATRVLLGDIFGVEKMIPWGTLVHSQLVGDYQEKALCIAQLSEFAENMGVRRKYREAIEQCADEMLMNALYDAPVDEEGKQIFSEIPTKTRISLRVEQKVVVQYACDGKRFALSVRDAFGTLERGTVLKYLHKCLHAEQQIDRKAGGAGLGLYLMVNSATTVYFNVLPGVATEALCIFDLETPKLQLEQFGFFTEKIDASGRLASGPSRKLPAGASHPVERRSTTDMPAPSSTPRALVAILGLAIVAMFALITIAAWPRLFAAKKTSVSFESMPKGASIEIDGKPAGTTGETPLVRELEVGRGYPVLARLDGYEPKQEVIEPRGSDRVTFQLVALAPKIVLDSQPSGAGVEIDGKPLGLTPLVVSTLAPGASVSIRFTKAGHQEVTAKLEVPGPGKEVRFVQPLAVSDELAKVHITSDPPGAQVVQNGQMLAGVVTPADVLVEGGKTQRFVLTMPHRVPAFIEPFTPGRGDDRIEKSGKLLVGSELRVEANLDGKITIANAPGCRDVATPATCTLAPGNYAVDFTGASNAHAVRNVAMTAKDRAEKLDFGYVQAGPGKQLRVAGAGPVAKAAFEVGPRNVTVSDDSGTHNATVRVKSGDTVTVE
jgi:CRISPR/Cas system-associated exonuclease Cas4 (RecB family)